RPCASPPPPPPPSTPSPYPTLFRSDEVLDALVPWQERHLSRGRIVPRDHLHVTTAFLGSTPATEVEGIAAAVGGADAFGPIRFRDRKSTRLNSSHGSISSAVFCLKK